MAEEIAMKVIARIHTDFPEKFGIPRQSGLVEALRAQSKEIFHLKAGTLYPLLHSLERDKLVTAREQETPGGRKRRYYRITAAGLRALEEKREQWAVYSRAVTAILAGA